TVCEVGEEKPEKSGVLRVQRKNPCGSAATTSRKPSELKSATAAIALGDVARFTVNVPSPRPSKTVCTTSKSRCPSSFASVASKDWPVDSRPVVVSGARKVPSPPPERRSTAPVQGPLCEAQTWQ